MRKYVTIVLLLAFTLLVGCKDVEDSYIDETTLFIDSNGRIECDIVEDFDESIYQIEELQETIRSQISFYKASNPNSTIKFTKCDVNDGKAYVNLIFGSDDDYAGFNHVDFYYGTVEEAIANDLCKSANLKNVHGSNTISGSNLSDLNSYHILITKDPILVKFPSSVLYSSGNVNLLEDKTAQKSASSGGYAYMIVK